MPTDIDQMLQRSQASDPQVIEALVHTYYAYIYRLALAILGNPDEAEDATQQTLIAAVLNFDRYRPGSNLRAWLYTIAVNTCRGHLRKRKTLQTLMTSLQAIRSLASSPPTPEESILQSEADSQLWCAVNALNERHRLPIVLRYVHGLSIREIAQVLDVKEGTVHSRLHYACRKLEKHLGRSDFEKSCEVCR